MLAKDIPVSVCFLRVFLFRRALRKSILTMRNLSIARFGTLILKDMRMCCEVCVINQCGGVVLCSTISTCYRTRHNSLINVDFESKTLQKLFNSVDSFSHLISRGWYYIAFSIALTPHRVRPKPDICLWRGQRVEVLNGSSCPSH